MLDTLEKLLNLIKKYTPSKIIFWVGSGIDYNKPTCLPLAKELLTEILNLSCGIEYSKKLLESFESMNSVGDIPRMETVISEIKRFENELSGPSTIITGFYSFLDAPPNDSHQILAQYLKRGANIVTTNYGNLVSKAFNLQYGDNSFPITPKFDDVLKMYTYSNPTITSGKIYHIHGVANNLKTVGISLDEVKNDLTTEFKKLLSYWIDNNYCFIFLGYSCSDTLDVNTFFENYQTNSSNQSTCIIIDFSTKNSFISKPNSKFQSILSPFHKQIVYQTNTTLFLDLIKIEEYTPCITIYQPFQWLDWFKDNIVPYNPILNKYITIGLIKTLGLSPSEILPKKWYQKTNDKSLFKREWYANYYGMNIIPVYKFFSKRKFANQLTDDNLTKSDKYIKNLRIKKAASVCMPLLQVKKFLTKIDCNSTIQKIDWQQSGSLNRNALWIIFDILKSPITTSRKITKHYNDAQIITECNNIIIDLGGSFVVDFTQIITAMRYNGILSMIYENNYEKAVLFLKKSAFLYKDISSMDGVVRCNLYLAFIEWINYKRNHNTQSLDNAKEYLNNTKVFLRFSIKSVDAFLYIILKLYIKYF